MGAQISTNQPYQYRQEMEIQPEYQNPGYGYTGFASFEEENYNYPKQIYPEIINRIEGFDGKNTLWIIIFILLIIFIIWYFFSAVNGKVLW